MHVVFNDGTSEKVQELNPELSYAYRYGLISSNEVLSAQRISTHYDIVDGIWNVEERATDFVDIKQLSS